MLTVHDLESIRRSAAMAPLSPADTTSLIDTCDQLLRERAQIDAALTELTGPWGSVRKTLSYLTSIVPLSDQ